MTRPLYHEGSRRLQDRFDCRRIADRLEAVTLHERLTAEDRAFIERSPMFFLATRDAEGWPDCSYKGGLPGFVRAADEGTLVFPSYDGNGMFRSLGNLLVDDRVGMLFIDFERPRRLRVQGRAALADDPASLAEFAGAQLVVRVRVERIFPNCPRYIPRMRLVEPSVDPPRPGHEPPVPDWKRSETFRDYLPRGGD